jgi:predicted RND superfamily exporter protein
MSNFYLTFDYSERTVTFAPKENALIVSTLPSSSSLSTGAIVGITLGSLAGLIFIVVITVYCYHRNKKNQEVKHVYISDVEANEWNLANDLLKEN